MASTPFVVLDTDVWSGFFVNRRARDTVFNAQIDDLRVRVLGRAVTVATQTAAEIRAGVLMSDWGGRRRREVRDRLDATPVLPVTESVVLAYSELTAECRRVGHGLQAKEHTGDRWVAATAIAAAVPLCAVDGIYRGAPGLDLIAPRRL